MNRGLYRHPYPFHHWRTTPEEMARMQVSARLLESSARQRRNARYAVLLFAAWVVLSGVIAHAFIHRF